MVANMPSDSENVPECVLHKLGMVESDKLRKAQAKCPAKNPASPGRRPTTKK